MVRRVRGSVLGAIALAVASLSVACAPDEPLKDWRAEAVEICEDSIEDFENAPGVVDPEAEQSPTDIAAELSERRLRALLEVPVPEGSEDAVAPFLDGVREMQDNLEAMGTALHDGDSDAFQELSAESLVLQEQIHQSASSLGVEVCAPDPG